MTAPAPKTFDLVVIGGGAGGLSCAVAAATLGLKVAVIEKGEKLGGTAAWSGGWLWIPRNALARDAGFREPPEAPLAYLRHELGNGFDAERVGRFLAQGPRMVDFFRRHSRLDFVLGAAIPDFHDASPGAGRGGRSLCAAPFDGRLLGRRLRDLRPPLGEISPFGMGVASGADLQNFLDATSKFSAFRYVVGRVLRHFYDGLTLGRGGWLVGGNALIARLLKSADDRGVVFFPRRQVLELVSEGGRVVGVFCAGDEKFFARRGVVLACGGFPHDALRKAELFPHDPDGVAHFSAAPHENNGGGLRLGEAVGGQVARDLPHAGAWAPVSLVPGGTEGLGRFPHLVERAKPGAILVRRDGKRFANEACSYHDLMQSLFAATPEGEPVEAWLICDHRFQRRYGLGRARPRPFGIGGWLRNGYLKRAATLEALAQNCGLDAKNLAETVAAVNRDARTGRDQAYGKGDSPYNRLQGEPGHAPNPCLGELVAAPFYAVKIVAGSLGTFAGLKVDAFARALDGDDRPIDGLYAVGADQASVMGGQYPAGGITLGPALTFGFVAAHHAAGVPLDCDLPV